MKAFIYSMCGVLTALFLLPSIAFSPAEPEKKASEEDGEISIASEKITILSGDNTLSMELEDYITGVVLAEMPASYEDEALKAQAVAARTYAVNKIRSLAHEGGALCTDYACCQAYIDKASYDGGDENLKKVARAVADTKGKIMTYNSEPISAVFHSMSAGRTASAEDVWGNSVHYLRSVESPLEENEEDFITTVTLPISEFTQKLKTLSSDYSGGLDIPPPDRDASGYVKRITIGSVTFSGNSLRNLFSLRSTNFCLGFSEGNALFTVKGYGHGVGMSQHGANLLAKNGASYEEILKTYYTGITVSDII